MLFQFDVPDEVVAALKPAGVDVPARLKGVCTACLVMCTNEAREKSIATLQETADVFQLLYAIEVINTLKAGVPK